MQNHFKMLSHAMQSTMTWLALFRKSLLGNQWSGNAAKGCLLVEASARLLLHSQISISWLVLNSAPSVNHFTWDWNHKNLGQVWFQEPKFIWIQVSEVCVYIYISTYIYIYTHKYILYMYIFMICIYLDSIYI